MQRLRCGTLRDRLAVHRIDDYMSDEEQVARNLAALADAAVALYKDATIFVTASDFEVIKHYYPRETGR
jgi:hypothetical protein